MAGRSQPASMRSCAAVSLEHSQVIQVAAASLCSLSALMTQALLKKAVAFCLAPGSDPKGRRFESCQPHHADALLESRAFFFCPVFGKAAPGAPSGMRTARPAGQRPGRFQQSCGLLESARVPAEPGWRNGSSAPSPSGRDHASRERSHSPRGEVAKYAPQERFLHAPAGAPKKALRKRKAFPFLWLVWLYTA